jgi:hypothetical protein
MVARPEGKRLSATPGLRWEDNIKIDVKVMEWDSVD